MSVGVCYGGISMVGYPFHLLVQRLCVVCRRKCCGEAAAAGQFRDSVVGGGAGATSGRTTSSKRTSLNVHGLWS